MRWSLQLLTRIIRPFVDISWIFIIALLPADGSDTYKPMLLGIEETNRTDDAGK
jgi:hypothetical protein